MSRELCYNRLMKNNRTLLISLIVIIALFIGAIIFVPQLTKKSGGSGDSYDTSSVDVTKYDTTKFIDANDDNGQIADHVKGDLKTAKVVLYEYADYQCSACALFQTWIKELLTEYDGQLAIVFRVYPITSLHPNAIAAASAVEAAGLQGYWEEMADLVFANQAEWFYATGNKRTEYFVGYFSSVSKGAGNIEQFKSDMAGDRVKAKISFDRSISDAFKLTATPSFLDENGQEIDFTADDIEQTKSGIQSFLRSYINQKLGK